MADKKEYRCPTCGGTSFSTELPMTQRWILGPDGVLERPVTEADIDTQAMENRTWTCQSCGLTLDGARFRELSVKQKTPWSNKVTIGHPEKDTLQVYEYFGEDYISPDNDSLELKDLPKAVYDTAYRLIGRGLETKANPVLLNGIPQIAVVAELVGLQMASEEIQEAWAEKLMSHTVQTWLKGTFTPKTDFSAFIIPTSGFNICRLIVVLPENTEERTIRMVYDSLRDLTTRTLQPLPCTEDEKRALRQIILQAVKLSLADKDNRDISLGQYIRTILEDAEQYSRHHKEADR